MISKLAYEHLPYCIVDENLQVLEISKALSDILGYSNETLKDKSFTTLIEHASETKLYNGCEYIKNNDGQEWGTELTLTTINAHEVQTHTIIHPVLKNGVHSGFIFIIRDITNEKLLHKLQVKMFSKDKIDKSALDFVSTTSAAVLDTVSTKVSLVVKLVVTFIFLFMIYSVTFKIDELARGSGQFIPTSKVQSIRNLEGGIVSDILISEGDMVKKGQILLKFTTLSHQTKLEENHIRIIELQTKLARLKAEASGASMKQITCDGGCNKDLLDLEKDFYRSNKAELNQKILQFQEQLKSKESELLDAEAKYDNSSKNYEMLHSEFEVKKQLERQKVFTKYELAILERELNNARVAQNSAKELIVQLKTQKEEIKKGIEESRLNFRNRASAQYNETIAEILRLKETQKNLKDIIERTVVRSPVTGTIKELFVHTIGTSVESSKELLTIVPDTQEMLAEVKIKPEEIAKLHIGQTVKLKVTAFDYSIYGDLNGKIVNISPDTIKDKDTNEDHYLIYVRTDKNYLLDNKKYKIKIGMTVSADVLVGKKTIMSFLLKPILKTTQRE
jgi:membrane fusion protein, adhesin transport system